jgi:hypothetical protein
VYINIPFSLLAIRKSFPSQKEMSETTHLLQMQATTAATTATPQQQQHRMDPNREVKVWVCDANGLRYGVRMPISSTFDDVRRKLLQENGNFQGIIVGFEGGRNERTIVSQTLPDPIPAGFNEANHLYEHPIQPTFKKVRGV